MKTKKMVKPVKKAEIKKMKKEDIMKDKKIMMKMKKDKKKMVK